jgi:hypothetical protein
MSGLGLLEDTSYGRVSEMRARLNKQLKIYRSRMHDAALEYGIVLKDLAVIDRQFKGDIASTMDKVIVSNFR